MILYFSGTGNSRLVAQTLAEHLQQPLQEWLKATPADLARAQTLCFVFPIYAWGLPKVLEQWFVIQKTLPKRALMVATCGDDIGKTHLQLRNLLRQKNCKLIGAFSVQMPNTYVAFPGFDVDSEEEQQRRLQAYPKRVEEIVQSIQPLLANDEAQELQTLSVVEGIFPWIKSHVLHPIFNNCLTGDHRFRSTDNCIHCRKCEKACPVNNITMTEEVRPQWLGSCTDCFGCYHACPVHAIRYGSWTEGKGQKRKTY